ncbi:MAG: hypothetical protein OER96_08075 [Gammaproteobacteria bacterium]|nr:hypothetical protein [Gammaproteobacteria bacterium]
MLEDDFGAGSVAISDAVDVHIELVNSNTGDRECSKMVNRHDAIVALVQRFARRQRISPRAVNIQVSAHP